MSLSERIAKEMIESQKAGDAARLSTLRMLKSVLRYKEIEKNAPLTEEEEIEVLSSAAKRHLDSIQQFKIGNRPDLVNKEENELKIVKGYLPSQLSEVELTGLVEEVIQEVQAKGKSDLGKVMKLLMPKVKGRADGKIVNQIVTTKLEQVGASEQE